MGRLMTYSSSLQLEPAGPNAWRGEADPAYAHRGGVGRFGGWTAAVLLKAAQMEEGERGDPLTLTVLFTEGVNDGAVDVSTRMLRAGARLQFWRSELAQGEKLCAHAQATFGVKRATDAWTDAAMPAVPPPGSPGQVMSSPPLSFGRQFEALWQTPSPFDPDLDKDVPTTSLVWVRDAHGRAMDHALLTLMADFAPPRVMFKRKTFVQSSTVSMTVHFHATAAELAEVGAAHVLSHVECIRCEGGYFEHELRLWSQSGKLLANSVQVAAYRD
jgi:acyl-CoA thioesterase